MKGPPLLDFLSGAVALAYLVAGVYFLRFWRVTRDRLFLRVLGFGLILAAIVGKNLSRRRGS
jgi:uncharacterized protein DUF5985